MTESFRDAAHTAHAGAPLRAAAAPGPVGPSAPPMKRGSMVPRPWGLRTPPVEALPGAEPPQAWETAARNRRNALKLAIAGATALATGVLWQTHNGWADNPWAFALQCVHLALFALLFAWVSAGCVTAVMGFWVMLRGDRHAISIRDAGNDPLGADARTALVMPICNEDVTTVFAGLRASCESLAAAGALRLFDVYILSDSSDPECRTQELAAWAELRAQFAGRGRVHYRWRQRRVKKKAGNVADFCRRWGRNYRYMVVLDADSVMSGDCLLGLVRLMEKHPRAGILQAANQVCGHDTPHARAQQFASRVTGRLFAAGMQFWQLGEAHYWGHNAIIRVEPFMKHCGLAQLNGKEIMSHDFVEAALMRRAGYQVWLVADLPGSYEQQPPHLLAELQRDRRWCQGNIQNAGLIAEPGLHGVHRAMLVTGALSYLAAPLWLLYVGLGVLLWNVGGSESFRPFMSDGSLAPGVAALWLGTIGMLVLPRLLSVAALILRGEQSQYGGSLKLIASCATEAGMSLLQAPLRMVAHSIFCVVALTGISLEWKSPPRAAEDVSWREAFAAYGRVSAVTAVIAAAIGALSPSTLIWVAPIALPLLLAAPIIVLSSRARLGERLRAAGLLVIPEESRTPTVLSNAWAYGRQERRLPGWTELIASRRLTALAAEAMGRREISHGVRARVRDRRLHELAAQPGALEALTPAERMRFLSEPAHLVRLAQPKRPAAADAARELRLAA
ncbi:MAG: glucans biosynthesis glucosyltransferase MdoH [Mitsuaria chitosanitabida]|uniref:glucans biosynthesis glucosyltransferase MdoH n=1 Tax=Roseateles chitosanitabidus TaxID=65048 RepID=UPI001B1A5727|nr:glucans biosynthesis glucosyltransferase MdoH [Roseateles chitosanitabidus]MBO9688782.1 glucans biosynthesis glucosyltransferase MdoH [Roseateles chitosanitabidus]